MKINYIQMHMRDKKRSIIGSVAALVVMITVAFFLTGFSAQSLAAETIGGDYISAGADFENGTLSGTCVVPTALSGEMALTLQPSLPQGNYISEPQQADYTFNALGLHWKAKLPEGSAVTAEVRFSQDGEKWGDWLPVNLIDDELPSNFASTKSAGETIGDLVFTDSGRFFQYRLDLKNNVAGQSPAVTKITASFIDTKGYHDSTLSVDTLSNKLAAVFSATQVSANPNIISRAQWGADDAYTQANWPPEYASPQKIVLHHTAGGWDADPAVTMRSIYYYHAVSLDWGDIGYNYVIGPQGQIYEGRMGGNGVIGGHALGWNTGTIGVAVMGDYNNYDINGSQYNAIVDFLSWEANVNHIDPYGSDYFIHYENGNPVGSNPSNILGHRDLAGNFTACPGTYLYAHLNGFRNDVYALNHGAITAFIIPEQEGTTTIDEDSHTIALTMPYGTDLTALVPSITITGASVSPSSGTAHDFTNPSTYTVTAADSSTQPYTVTVNVASNETLFTAKWNALGGAPGAATSAATAITGGMYKDYVNGRLIWNQSTDQVYWVHGAILTKYDQLGRETGALGLPISDEMDVTGVSGARESDFTGGRIFWGPGVGTYALTDPGFLSLFNSNGDAAYLGIPTSDKYSAWDGHAQNFQKAIFTWNPRNGDHYVRGGVMVKYQMTGGPAGYLHLIIDEEKPLSPSLPAHADAVAAIFENGRVYWSGTTGSHIVNGGVYVTYMSVGGPQGRLGLPITDEYDIALPGGGRRSRFEHGFITWGLYYGTWVDYI